MIPVTIVAETNQGGRMVKTILHTADPNLAVKAVTATRDKAHRADEQVASSPGRGCAAWGAAHLLMVAHLFEAGKVMLHGRFPALEAELLGLIAGGGYEGPGGSPDRADAMMSRSPCPPDRAGQCGALPTCSWALTELMLREKGGPRVRGIR